MRIVTDPVGILPDPNRSDPVVEVLVEVGLFEHRRERCSRGKQGDLRKRGEGRNRTLLPRFQTSFLEVSARIRADADSIGTGARSVRSSGSSKAQRRNRAARGETLIAFGSRRRDIRSGVLNWPGLGKASRGRRGKKGQIRRLAYRLLYAALRATVSSRRF